MANHSSKSKATVHVPPRSVERQYVYYAMHREKSSERACSNPVSWMASITFGAKIKIKIKKHKPYFSYSNDRILKGKGTKGLTVKKR